jgi:diguanylate cyclase (GGDEF)-like protein
VAKVIQDTLTRVTDFCARYGGEEFVVILPDTNLDAAQQVASKIIENVIALGIEHGFSNAADIVTVSIGCASIDGQQLQKCASLVDLADKALYKAKNSGRNRIEVANSEDI